MIIVQLFKLRSFLLLFIFLTFFNSWVFTFPSKNIISYSYEDIDLKSALQEIIKKNEISIIFPDETQNIIISKSCYECSIEDGFNYLLEDTKYKWLIIGSQYTIYEPKMANQYELSGLVKDRITGQPITHANVYIPDLKIGSVTRYDGKFSFHDLNILRGNLIISYIGYDHVSIPFSFSEYEKRELEVLMSPKVILSEKVFIFGSASDFIETSQRPGQISFSPRFISSFPNLGEVDILRSLQLLPGIQLGHGGTSELFIKGGDSDHNLLVLDGMPIYTSNRMFGFISGLNSNAIKDVQIFSGNIPAEYGGKINSIIKLTSKSGNNQKIQGSIQTNFLSQSFSIETPVLKKGSFILNFKKSNDFAFKSSLYKSIYDFKTGNDQFNLISESITKDDDIFSSYEPKSSFSDIITKFSILFSPDHSVAITHIDGTDLTTEKRTFIGFSSILGEDSSKVNRTINKHSSGTALNLYSNWNTRVSTHITLSKSGIDNIENTIQHIFPFYADPNVLGSALVKSKIDDLSYKMNLNYNLRRNSQIKLGFSYSLFTLYNSENKVDGLFDNFISNYQENTFTSFYFQNLFSLKDMLILQPGFRTTKSDLNDKLHYSPRLSLKYKVMSKIFYEFSYGKQYQFLRHVSNDNLNDNRKFHWKIISDNIPEINSSNFFNGISYNSENFSLKINSYYRDQNNLIFNLDIYEEQFSEGNAYSKGLEILFRKKYGLFHGWLSYHFSETKLLFDDINNGVEFFDDNDITDEIKCVLISKIKDFNLTATWVYSSGRVFTDMENLYVDPGYKIIVSDKRNNKRLSPNHHLDISISSKKVIKKFILDYGFSIYNIYNKNNVSHKSYNPYSSTIRMEQISMFGITSTGFLKVSF